MWHFRNERNFTTDKSKSKSSFNPINPRNKDAIIETCLEERLLDIKTFLPEDTIISVRMSVMLCITLMMIPLSL